MGLIVTYNYELTYINTKTQIDDKFRIEFPDVKDRITQIIKVKDAYCEIVKIEGNKEKMDIVLSIYKDRTKTYVIETKVYSFTPSSTDSMDSFMQAYEYLKGLPEFEYAIFVDDQSLEV
ncbi:hypothetical protein NST77_23250 [Niallia sp. FSL W8-0177]|uniref:hypothetical protein n=1 Tax=Niallia sp. FSL W8-0177 TaxID=2954522 RepID=UPI0030F88AB6